MEATFKKRLYKRLVYTYSATNSAIRYSLVFFIKLYQIVFSLWRGPCCRFYPSCSNYAIQALSLHSLTRALYLIVKRLLRCHPGYPGGIDDVPLPPPSK